MMYSRCYFNYVQHGLVILENGKFINKNLYFALILQCRTVRKYNTCGSIGVPNVRLYNVTSKLKFVTSQYSFYFIFIVQSRVVFQCQD